MPVVDRGRHEQVHASDADDRSPHHQQVDYWNQRHIETYSVSLCDILPAVNGRASHARTAMRWFGNLGFPVRRTGGSATPPVLLSGVQDGHDDLELRGLFSVGLLSTGLLFDEANTESTASLWTAESRIASLLGPTPDRTCVWHSNLPILLCEDDEGRCIPALKGEVLAPCTAADKPRPEYSRSDTPSPVRRRLPARVDTTGQAAGRYVAPASPTLVSPEASVGRPANEGPPETKSP